VSDSVLKEMAEYVQIEGMDSIVVYHDKFTRWHAAVTELVEAAQCPAANIYADRERIYCKICGGVDGHKDGCKLVPFLPAPASEPSHDE
jgi:hypothetical protein